MKSWTKVATIVVMFACALALILWDVFVAANHVPGDTISEIVLKFGRTYPIAMFGVGQACGVILGHCFWPQNRKE